MSAIISFEGNYQHSMQEGEASLFLKIVVKSIAKEIGKVEVVNMKKVELLA